MSQLPKLQSSSSWLYTEAAHIKKNPVPFVASTYSSSQTQMGNASYPTGFEQSTAFQFLGPTQKKKMQTSANGPHNSGTHLDHLAAENFLPEWTTWGPPGPAGVSIKKLAGKSSSNHSSFQSQTDSLKMLPGVEQFPFWWSSSPTYLPNKEPSYDPSFFSVYDSFDHSHFLPLEEDSLVLDHMGNQNANACAAGGSATSSETIPCTRDGGNRDDILNKFLLFKQFDTVQDHSDHHYSFGISSPTQVTVVEKLSFFSFL